MTLSKHKSNSLRQHRKFGNDATMKQWYTRTVARPRAACLYRGFSYTVTGSVAQSLESKSSFMRIGIVNDLGLAREALRRVVMTSSEHKIAWMASDGAEAIALARVDRPDLILMDLFMPGIDGVEATRRIMGESPCAILVVTSTVTGHLSKVYQAMGYGALDALDTPTLGSRGQLSGAAYSCTRSSLSAS